MKNHIYIDDYFFEKEKKILTQDTWILICHKNELAKKNDFVTIEYYGNKIFLQNFNNEVRAYQNICLHRFNIIHKERYGNRIASCLYHNWNYNSEGRVKNISCNFTFEKSSFNSLKLKEYEISYCGDFIFLKLNNRFNTSIQEYLGNLFQPLKEFSRYFGSKTIDYIKEHNANWKLLVENVLECYHCSSVHQNTFFKMGYGVLSPKEYDFFDGHSWCTFPKLSENKENKIVSQIFNKSSYTTQGYVHFYIYPNAFISSVEGKGFYFGFLSPISPNQTNLTVKYYSAKIDNELNEIENNLFEFINESSIESLDLILNEDKEIVESIQQNLNSVINSEPIFGNEEFRIENFYKFYNQKIQ